MPKYKVIIHYEGALDYIVEADSLNEAEQKAYALYGNEDGNVFIGHMADSFIADSWRVD